MIKELKRLNVGVLLAIALLLVLVTAALLARSSSIPNSYAECMTRKDAKVLETYPQQCVVDGKSFTSPINDTVIPELGETPGEAEACSETC